MREVVLRTSLIPAMPSLFQYRIKWSVGKKYVFTPELVLCIAYYSWLSLRIMSINVECGLLSVQKWGQLSLNIIICRVAISNYYDTFKRQFIKNDQTLEA